MNYNVKIAGAGICVPSKILSNTDLEKIVDTSDEWIVTRTGMKERRIASKETASSDLAVRASKDALKSSNIHPEQIDLIIVATATPDMIFPSTACFVQSKIGAKNAAAFDVSAVCSGFIYGLSVAEQYLKTGKYKKILLIGAEVVSKFLNWEDRTTCVLFGDGAGAVVLESEKASKDSLFSTHIHSDGRYAEILSIPGGGSRNPIGDEAIQKKMHTVHMDGGKIFKIAVKSMVQTAKEALRQNNLEISDVDLVVPHQANMRIIKAIYENLNLPKEKVFINIEKYGNTSAASIPIALSEAIDQGRINKGNIVLMLAFGGGLTWGSAIMRW